MAIVCGTVLSLGIVAGCVYFAIRRTESKSAERIANKPPVTLMDLIYGSKRKEENDDTEAIS